MLVSGSQHTLNCGSDGGGGPRNGGRGCAAGGVWGLLRWGRSVGLCSLVRGWLCGRGGCVAVWRVLVFFFFGCECFGGVI
mgnify:CR=1 FL=1